ncbi:hypothetical protein [Bacillus sp. AFS031507]|uniref:hypothetical protein n=1 Tax=Bacillus sp. AFS031507 TaxID=2033496 RepID=UPI000BFB81DC|nr:hypothetical protein [Bacillus sp. AFS031507]
MNDIIEKDETFLAGEPDSGVIQKEWDATQKEMVRMQNILAFQELEDEINEKKQTMEQVSTECEKWNEAAKQTDALTARITAAQ